MGEMVKGSLSAFIYILKAILFVTDKVIKMGVM